jgi:hypothetical protein
MTQKPFLTRKKLARVIEERIGIPMSPHKLAIASSKGCGPKPKARHGRIFLYDEDDGLAWGWSLVSPVQNDPQAA